MTAMIHWLLFLLNSDWKIQFYNIPQLGNGPSVMLF